MATVQTDSVGTEKKWWVTWLSNRIWSQYVVIHNSVQPNVFVSVLGTNISWPGLRWKNGHPLNAGLGRSESQHFEVYLGKILAKIAPQIIVIDVWVWLVRAFDETEDHSPSKYNLFFSFFDRWLFLYPFLWICQDLKLNFFAYCKYSYLHFVVAKTASNVPISLSLALLFE